VREFHGALTLASPSPSRPTARCSQRRRATGSRSPRRRRALLQTLVGHTFNVLGLAWSPNGSCRVRERRQDAKIWRVVNGQALTLTGHTSLVDAVAFSPNGQTLATAATT
jgi:WD40 repeat protein